MFKRTNFPDFPIEEQKEEYENFLEHTISGLNYNANLYLKTHDPKHLEAITDLLPISFFVSDNLDYGTISDGYHTFNELYHHRAVLFSVICNSHPELAWKSKSHHNPEDPMYEGMFIVGIETPKGQATYHYNLNPYWDMFKVKELERAPEWDGHSANDAIERIASLNTK